MATMRGGGASPAKARSFAAACEISIQGLQAIIRLVVRGCQAGRGRLVVPVACVASRAAARWLPWAAAGLRRRLPLPLSAGLPCPCIGPFAAGAQLHRQAGSRHRRQRLGRGRTHRCTGAVRAAVLGWQGRLLRLLHGLSQEGSPAGPALLQHRLSVRLHQACRQGWEVGHLGSWRVQHPMPASYPWIDCCTAPPAPHCPHPLSTHQAAPRPPLPPPPAARRQRPPGGRAPPAARQARLPPAPHLPAGPPGLGPLLLGPAPWPPAAAFE